MAETCEGYEVAWEAKKKELDEFLSKPDQAGNVVWTVIDGDNAKTYERLKLEVKQAYTELWDCIDKSKGLKPPPSN